LVIDWHIGGASNGLVTDTQEYAGGAVVIRFIKTTGNREEVNFRIQVNPEELKSPPIELVHPITR